MNINTFSFSADFLLLSSVTVTLSGSMNSVRCLRPLNSGCEDMERKDRRDEWPNRDDVGVSASRRKDRGEPLNLDWDYDIKCKMSGNALNYDLDFITRSASCSPHLPWLPSPLLALWPSGCEKAIFSSHILWSAPS